MCYQITEHYSACRCVYYIHSIDRCAAFDQPGHGVQKRTVLVGYACSSHSPSNASSHTTDENTGVGEVNSSDDEDGASVFSDVSAPSTNLTFPDDAKQGATDRLFQELLNEFSLRHLWPQIVRIFLDKDKAAKTIARYLSRFSRDLKTHATSRLNKDAAGFVGISRLTVAERIVECHINEIDRLDELISIILTKEAPLTAVIEDYEETEDLDTEVKNIIYENVQQFIFEGAPFQSFITALRLFVSNATESRPVLSTSVRQDFNYLLSRHWKSPEIHHQTRVPWTCAGITIPE